MYKWDEFRINHRNSAHQHMHRILWMIGRKRERNLFPHFILLPIIQSLVNLMHIYWISLNLVDCELQVLNPKFQKKKIPKTKECKLTKIWQKQVSSLKWCRKYVIYTVNVRWGKMNKLLEIQTIPISVATISKPIANLALNIIYIEQSQQ